MKKEMSENEMLAVISEEFKSLSDLYHSSEAFYIVLYRLLDELDILYEEYCPNYLNWNDIRDLQAYARTQEMSCALHGVNMEDVNQSTMAHVKLMLHDLMLVIGDN